LVPGQGRPEGQRHIFLPVSGGGAAGAAIYASDGNYYGVSQATNASTGYVYRVTPSGVLTKLYRFPAGTFSGYFALPLLEGSDGNLYGATPNGGANGTGAIYKLTLGGQYTLLYSFPKGNLGGPTALIEGSDGNLYGATLEPSGMRATASCSRSARAASIPCCTT